MTDLREYSAAVRRWCGSGSQSLEEALSLDQTAGQRDRANSPAVLYNAPDDENTHNMKTYSRLL